MNKVVLMGRLTRDPEMRYSQSDEPIAIVRYGIAINRRAKRPGEPDVDFFDCVVFSKAAEFASRYFKKGMMVAISGRLQNSSWDDKQTGQKRFKTEIIVDDQEFAESKASFESRQGSAGYNADPMPQDPYAPSAGSGFANEPPQQNAYNQPDAGNFTVIPSSDDEDDLPF